MATRRNSGLKVQPKPVSSVAPGNIRVSSVLIFIFGFLIAVLTILLGQNFFAKESVNLSTIDILNLVLTSALSVSSILLAVVAIVLSKKSEEIIMNQTTEGRDLQNALFTRTIEVLARIESSSGINEKRIDDISRAVAELPRHTAQNREEEIRKIVRTNLLPDSSPSSSRVDNRIAEEEYKNEENFKNKIVLGVANIRDINVEKIGEGDIEGRGDDLVDGIFSYSGKRFTVSTFYIRNPDQEISFVDDESFKSYLVNLGNRISEDAYVKCFLVFNKLQSNDTDFGAAYKQVTQLVDEKIRNGIEILVGSPEEILTDLGKKIEKALK